MPKKAAQRKPVKKSVRKQSAAKCAAAHVEPYECRGHHLLCAVCVRGGCKSPPPGKAVIDKLLTAMWADANLPLKITADVGVTEAHYLDVYEGRNELPLPENFAERAADYVYRKKDLEVLRRLGIPPGAVLPARRRWSASAGRTRERRRPGRSARTRRRATTRKSPRCRT